MAISKEKVLARLNLDINPITQKLKTLGGDFTNIENSIKHTFTAIRNESGDVVKKITTDFTELSNQATRLTKTVESLQKDGSWNKATTVSDTSLLNYKKYFEMLKLWWSELSNEQRGSISLLKTYQERLGSLAAQVPDNAVKSQVLNAKETIDGKVDTAVAQAQKNVYSEISRLLQEQYFLQTQMQNAGENEKIILQQKLDITNQDLSIYQELLNTHSSILKNKEHEAQLTQTGLNIEQQKQKAIDMQAAALSDRNQKVNEYLLKNQEALSLINQQTIELQKQAATEYLTPKKPSIDSSTILGKFQNSGIYLASGMLQSSIWKAFQSSLSAVTQYEQGIVNLRRTMQDVTENELKDLGETAIEYAKKFGLALNEVQDTMTELARAGIDDSALLKELTQAVSIGVNTTEISSASEMVGYLISTLKQLKMEFSDTMKILDTWNYLADQYAVHTNDFAEAIQRAGSASYNFGLDLYDVNAMVTILGEATQASGNMIGTALKAMEVRLLRPDTVAVLESYGIAVKKNSEEFLTFQEILNNVYDKMQNLSESSVAYQDITQAMGGSFRANWVATLVANWDEFDKLVEEQKNVGGYSLEENAKAMDTLAKKIEQCKETFLAMFIEVANNTGITDFLKNTVDALSSFLNALNKSGVLAFVVEVGKMILVFKAALIPLKLLNKAIGVDLIKAVKDLAKLGLSKVFKTDGISVYDKAVQKIQKNLEKANIPLGEQIALLQKIDKRLGTNVAGKLEFEEKSKSIKLVNDKLEAGIKLCDENITQQLKLNDDTKDYTDIVNDLVGSDKVFIDQKLTELKLSDEQSVKIKENIAYRQDLNNQLEVNNQQMDALKISTGQNTTVLQTNKASLIGAKAATLGLAAAQMVLQTAMSFGIGLALSAIVQGITSLINRNKELRQAAVEAAKDMDKEIESIEKQRDKVTQLNEVISDNTTSLEDAADARADLLEIQKELVEAYGAEAAAIDLLNSSAKQQQETIVSLAKAEADNYLRENQKAINNAENYLTKNGTEYVKEHFTLITSSVNTNTAAFKKYAEMDQDGGYYVTGTYEERIEKLQGIYDELERLSKENGTADNRGVIKQLEKLSEQISKLKNKDKYTENLEVFEATGKARFISQYTSLYSDILSAQNEFDEAYKSGDQKRIDTALDMLIKYKNEAIKKADGNTAIIGYIENELYSVYNTTIENALSLRDALINTFGKNLYNTVLSEYETSVLGQLDKLTSYFSNFFTSSKTTASAFLSSIGVDINNLSYDLLKSLNNFTELFDDSKSAMETLNKITASSKAVWENMSDSAEACGLTFEDFYHSAILGASNLDKYLKGIDDTVKALNERLNETLNEANDWISTAKSVKDLNKYSKEYYDTVREIGFEYPELVEGIDELTGAYILAANYEDYITQKQKELVEEQNNLLEKQYLSAIAAAESYKAIAVGNEAVANANEELARAYENYERFITSKGTVYDSSAADAIAAATLRATKAIEAATKAVNEFNKSIALLGEIDTEEEKMLQAGLLAKQYTVILEQIALLEEELRIANEEDIEGIADKIQELKELKVSIEDTTKAMIRQTYEQQKQNELDKIQIDQATELAELEKQIYGSEGKDAYEKRIEKQLQAISDEQNSEIVSALAQAYIDGDEARIAALREILETQQDITSESEKQLQLEKLKLELENAKRNRNIQILTKDDNGNWQFTYTYDYDKVADLETQIKETERDFVSEQVQKELDNMSDSFDEQSEIIKTAYADLTIQTEIFYNDMAALVNEKFDNISADIAGALEAMTEASITAERIAIALAEWLLRTQLSAFDGSVDQTLTNATEGIKGFKTGGYTGEREGLAFLHAKERVLNEKQTSAFETLVSSLPELVTTLPELESFADSLKSILQNGNGSPSSKTEIYIDKLEFPNISKADGLQEAILNLPTVVAQYQRG